MKKKTNKKQNINKLLILSIALAVVTIFIGVVFIYMPYASRTKSLADEILRERDRNVLAGKIEALEGHLKIYKKRVPSGKGVSWLLAEVSDMARKEHIEVESVKPGSPEARGLYTRLYVIMDVFAEYNQIGKFISRVESAEKFMRIEDINMKRIDLDKTFDPETARYNGYDLEASIVISTMVLKD